MFSANGESTQEAGAIFDNDMKFTDYNPLLMHRIHGFAAKFSPGLPRYFIKELTLPGDVVLDPMTGSGTTLLEAMLLDRRGIGVDITRAQND